MRLTKTSVKNQQGGFVSIIVTLIMMIVITLIVLGFAQLSRREQRAALDRHLSTQAFYAAESGINDLVASIKNPANSIYFAANKSTTNCLDTATIPGLTPIIDAPTNVEYTCALYDADLENLTFNDVSTDRVTSIPLDNSDLTELRFSWWHTKEDQSNFGPSPFVGRFTSNTVWNANYNAGVLRVEIFPRSGFDRRYYMDNRLVAFLYPTNGGVANGFGSVAYVPNQGFTTSGAVVSSACVAASQPRYCNARITGLSPSPSGWFVVLRSIYMPSQVIISCHTGGGSSTNCQGGQVLLDVTGKAGDVTRRVQVRKSLNPVSDDTLPLGFQSVGSICKQIVVAPPNVEQDSSAECPSF